MQGLYGFSLSMSYNFSTFEESICTSLSLNFSVSEWYWIPMVYMPTSSSLFGIV
uniref:Uncharacterized protein n=1 Tax=Manihot esculenta TaxID=3983 RepID=A0A2C9V7X5_MANES